MKGEVITLRHADGQGYVIPAGPVSLVFVTTTRGLVGCGAIDVMALNSFNYAAARVRPVGGPSISTITDLLVGEIKEANESARKLGVFAGMTGKEALDILSQK